MKFYAVIDTNVLVSALLKRNSAPWQILSESINGTIVPLYNGEILSEYTEVLLRKKFNFPENLVLDLLRELSKCGILINAERTQEQFPDPDDAVFYEVVMSARELQPRKAYSPMLLTFSGIITLSSAEQPSNRFWGNSLTPEGRVIDLREVQFAKTP